MSPETHLADLEIGLHRHDPESYSVEMRFTPPDSDAEVRLVRGDLATAQFDLAALRELALDPAAYGRALGQGLFGDVTDSEVRTAFDQARVAANSQGVPLRLRLFIGPSAPELQGLNWEMLADPAKDTALLTDEHIFFSRYLSSFDWQPVRLRPRTALRALVVIANPSDVSSYQPRGVPLASVDVAGELERARAGLAGMTLVELASGGAATLKKLTDHLRDGFDILYLVCHGALIKGEPKLWLEGADGASDRVAGGELVTRLQELWQRPRLVVLASCQSAGRSSDEGALAALGPRLAEAGIPAVVAMQGDITMETVSQFMPVFFTKLAEDGQVDCAMASARNAVQDRPDWWAPALYMRLRSGRIWYTPGFAEEVRGLEKWPALVRNIRSARCTPILGPGLAEALLGSRRELAQRWAETYHFPMAPQDRDDLPQVAQYLAVNQDPMFPRGELAEYLKQMLVERLEEEADPSNAEHRALVERAAQASAPDAPLDDLFKAVGALHLMTDPAEPHRVLANLPLPIFITTDPSSLLTQALESVGKQPRVEFCRWNPQIESLPSIYDAEPNYRPSIEQPLVYHLFGRLGEPDSIVLAEDDYFDYLIGVTSNNDLIPPVVRRALTDTALLFLGFRLDAWDFRVLFRSIMNREGSGRRTNYAHVAAQVDPEEGRILEPVRARRYLESYFGDAKISIFWGSVEDFATEIQTRMG
jgi:hypothetical protein